MDKHRLKEIIRDIREGRVKHYQLDSYCGPSDQVEIRRHYLESTTHIDLKPLALSPIDAAEAGLIIESCFGAIRIPVGFAGPMKLRWDNQEMEIFVPLATTEGALVASVNRGIQICNSAGGIYTEIFSDRMTRAPIFQGTDPHHVKEAISWIEDHQSEIADCARQMSGYCRLKAIEPFPLGNILNLRFLFKTGDAMGMNMVTFTTEKCAELIVKYTGLKLVAVAGNLCSDKKATAINAILGRGKTTAAWAWLPTHLIKEKLRTPIERLLEVVQKKVWLGSAQAQSLSFNAHTANIIAAIFAATGQDLAQVIESATSFIWLEILDDKVLAIAHLPSLEVGTVGGGTSLKGQNALLRLVGCTGLGSARKFAAIISAAVLAGELSYLGAIAAGEAVDAHHKLGRRLKTGDAH